MGVSVEVDREWAKLCSPTHPIEEDSRGALMLDLFYIAVVIAFFALLWGFTKASERM